MPRAHGIVNAVKPKWSDLIEWYQPPRQPDKNSAPHLCPIRPKIAANLIILPKNQALPCI